MEDTYPVNYDKEDIENYLETNLTDAALHADRLLKSEKSGRV
jgi:hypothetical protein